MDLLSFGAILFNFVSLSLVPFANNSAFQRSIHVRSLHPEARQICFLFLYFCFVLFSFKYPERVFVITRERDCPELPSA